MKRQLRFFAVNSLTVLALLSLALAVPTSASAAGATQISGIGYFAEPGECDDPEGAGATFALRMEGDLEGCHYVFVESSVCGPSGTYLETGRETFVGEGLNRSGTFRTTYKFEAKYVDCETLEVEIFGRCQHPIIAGSGTDDFEGVSGRLDFKDDIEAGNFPYRGHLKW